MSKASIIALSIFFPMCLGLPVCAEEIPKMAECTSIVLRASGGWWVMINRDGSGSYGFGVQPDRVRVKKGAFDFRQIYRETRKACVETRKNAEGPYIAVSYYIAGSSSAREYYLPKSRQWLADVFFAARENALPASNEMEERSHDRIEDFWIRSPFTGEPGARIR